MKSEYILEKLLSHLSISANELSIEIGLKHNNSIYHIKNGRNDISRKMAKRIVDRFPKINYDWLLTGEGDMLASKDLSEDMSKEIKSDLKERIEILEDTVRLQDKKIEALRKFKDSQGDLLMGVEFYKNEVLELKELIQRKIGVRLDGSQKG